MICVSMSVTPHTHTHQERGFGNVRVITGDINEFDLSGEDKGSFDRVMSIEMFEHMKNYKLLIAKISGWLAPGGKLFGGLEMLRRGLFFFLGGGGGRRKGRGIESRGF